MNLRLRLIVVFFLLSVVPVGAVTYYTYASNAQAIRDAASSEAAQLAGELSQRMRAVTTQLSQRVETLMELPPAGGDPARGERAPSGGGGAEAGSCARSACRARGAGGRAAGDGGARSEAR